MDLGRASYHLQWHASIQTTLQLVFCCWSEVGLVGAFVHPEKEETVQALCVVSLTPAMTHSREFAVICSARQYHFNTIESLLQSIEGHW